MRSSTDNWVELIRADQLTERNAGLLLMRGQFDKDPVLLSFIRETYPRLHRRVSGYHDAMVKTWKTLQVVRDPEPGVKYLRDTPPEPTTWNAWKHPHSKVLTYWRLSEGEIPCIVFDTNFGDMEVRALNNVIEGIRAVISWTPLHHLRVRLSGRGAEEGQDAENWRGWSGSVHLGNLIDPETLGSEPQQRLRFLFDKINKESKGLFLEDLEHVSSNLPTSNVSDYRELKSVLDWVTQVRSYGSD